MILRLGDNKSEVKLLQAYLKVYQRQLKIDGIFGKQTLSALKQVKGVEQINTNQLSLKMKLVRFIFNDRQTIGKLYLNDQMFCYTLEDKNRDLNKNGKFDDGLPKVYAKTCIPFGTYKVIVNYSPKFKRLMPRLLNVPYFEGILMHSGYNELNSAGCILLSDKIVDKHTTNSKKIFEDLFEILNIFKTSEISIV